MLYDEWQELFAFQGGRDSSMIPRAARLYERMDLAVSRLVILVAPKWQPRCQADRLRRRAALREHLGQQ